MKTILHIALVLALLLGTGARLEAGDIVLRASVRLAPGEPVRLADIAVLFGADAEKHGDIVIESSTARGSGGEVREVSLDAVRRALADAGASFGRLSLTGSTCRVLPATAPSEPASETAEETGAKAEVVPLEGPPTVRRTIAAHLAELYDVPPDRIRLLFEVQDRAFIDEAQWGRKVILTPTTSASSRRMMIDVRTYAGGGLAASRTVSVEAEVLRDVYVLRHDMQRGETVTVDAVMPARLWLSPFGAPPVTDGAEIEGATLRARLQSGAVVRTSHLRPPVLVRRNELVDVYCVVGGVEIVTKARSLGEGRRDEMVELRLEHASRAFMARVVGRGIVAVDMTQTNAEGDAS